MTTTPPAAEANPGDNGGMRSDAHADLYPDVAGYHQEGRLPGPAGEPKPYKPATGRAGLQAADRIDRQEAEAKRQRLDYQRPADDLVSYGTDKVKALRESLHSPSGAVPPPELKPPEAQPPVGTPEQPELPF